MLLRGGYTGTRGRRTRGRLCPAGTPGRSTLTVECACDLASPRPFSAIGSPSSHPPAEGLAHATSSKPLSRGSTVQRWPRKGRTSDRRASVEPELSGPFSMHSGMEEHAATQPSDPYPLTGTTSTTHATIALTALQRMQISRRCSASIHPAPSPQSLGGTSESARRLLHQVRSFSYTY